MVFGSAFFNPQPKPDDSQVLDVIPFTTVDARSTAVFATPRRLRPPPAPAPVVVPPPQPLPPTPVVQPAPEPPAPKPVVPPPPTLIDKVEKIFSPQPKPEPVRPEPVKPAPNTPQPKSHQIQVNTQLVSRAAPKISTPTVAPQRDTRAFSAALQNLKRNLSPGMTVDMPGESSVAYASYRDALATIYYNAWITPNDMANDEAITTVKITVASDGTVIHARIITPSGDAKADDSVRSALDRVPSVPPLPDKSKSERDFEISFNLKAKRMLE